MRLYIVRHAFAGEHGDPKYPDDSLRPLTKKGRRQFDRLLKLLVQNGFRPEIVGTSPYLRCRQTAEMIVERLRPGIALQPEDSFAPGCQPGDVINWLRKAMVEQAAYVGHAPDVDQVTAALLGSGEAAVRFSKGAVAALDLDLDLPTPSGTLRWLVNPKLLKG